MALILGVKIRDLAEVGDEPYGEFGFTKLVQASAQQPYPVASPNGLCECL